MLSKINIILLLLFVFFSNNLWAEDLPDSDNPVLVWKAIPNVKDYQLQVRNSSQEIIIDEKLSDTTYLLDIEPGKYEHRVGIYNKFDKVSVFSDWIPFVISRSPTPEVTSEIINYGSKTNPNTTLRIEGKNFVSKIKISLKNSSTDFPIISVNRLSSTVIELVLNNQEAAIGKYDLVLENPRKKILTLEKFYTLNAAETITENIETKDTKQSNDVKDTKPPNDVKDTKQSNDVKDTKADMYYPYWSSGARSMLLPGWGQFHKEQKLKGILLDASLLLSILYFKSSTDTFNANKEKYNASVNQTLFISILSEQNTLLYAQYMMGENQFLKTESSSNRAYQASILVGALYLVNILDALFWKIPPKTTADISVKKFQIYANIQNTSVNVNTMYQPQLELGVMFRF